MKITDIVSRKSEIFADTSELFVAEKDFSFEGLPILKDSLVYYDRNRIYINMIEYGLFQKNNFPAIIKAILPIGNKGNQMVEKCSTCEFEVEVLGSGLRGIWHQDHFDLWYGTFSDYFERINQIPVLVYSGISFSSLMYQFDISTKKLIHFINTEPFELELADKIVDLTGFLEISLGKTFHTIIPVLGEIDFCGIKLHGWITFSDDGFISGKSAQEFDAIIYGNENLNELKINEGKTIEISNNGEMKTSLFNEKTQKAEKFNICKVQ